MARIHVLNQVIFKNRQDAGELLAEHVRVYRGKNVLILGLSRGGIVVARTVAKMLNIPFDVLVVKKLSSPYEPELAIGALAPDGISVIHSKDARRVGADEEYVRIQITKLKDYIKRKTLYYRRGNKPHRVLGKTVILVDDGAATGATMEVAVRWARKKRAAKIIVALPVASLEAMNTIRSEVDALIVHASTDALGSVGEFYQSFEQVED
ncbi:MAG TPA: phosphoribosyltransferase family protein, partial [Patescibacteria group bacterium]|nr:phosphoribosyltransferase family protein [Patescibacteria group bacterium]